MITVLIENDAIFNATSFGLDLHFQTELKLIKRKSKDINLDVSLLKPDVLLIYLCRNSQGLIEKVKSIRSIDKNIKIILIVDFYSEHVFWIAKRLKLSGIFKKDMDLDEFIKKVLSTIIDSNNNSIKEHNSTIDIEQIVEALSCTEITVFGFIGHGFTSQEISNSLGVSKRTIDAHRCNILKKLNCNNSSKLIYLASAYNLFKFFE